MLAHRGVVNHPPTIRGTLEGNVQKVPFSQEGRREKYFHVPANENKWARYLWKMTELSITHRVPPGGAKLEVGEGASGGENALIEHVCVCGSSAAILCLVMAGANERKNRIRSTA